MLKPSVLVTGGNGYLGSVLVEELSVRGYQIIVLDNCLTSLDFPSSLKNGNVSYICGDVRDPTGLESVLKGIDAVVHLASIVGDPACNAASDLAWDINYLGTINLAKACVGQASGGLFLPRRAATMACSSMRIWTNWRRSILNRFTHRPRSSPSTICFPCAMHCLLLAFCVSQPCMGFRLACALISLLTL